MMDKNYISAELENKMSVNENPFPFAHIEGLLPTEIAKKAEIEFLEFNNLENAGNKRYQNTKVVFNEFENMPGTIKDIISFLYSKQFMHLLEKKFNLPTLEPDWSLHGGGMHQSFNGGFLKVHSDFIYKRKSKQKRVLNLLLYLNSNWKNEWNGSIEFWDKHMKNLKFSTPPIINNAVVFRTDVESNHGFPDAIKCPNEQSRKSIALYYYIRETSFLPFTLKKRKHFHAVWKKRPNKNEPTFSDQNTFFKKLKNKFFFRLF